MLLLKGKWGVRNRIGAVILSFAGAIVLLFMLGASWIDPEGLLALGQTDSAEALMKLANIISVMLKTGFLIGVIASTIDMIKQIIKIKRYFC